MAYFNKDAYEACDKKAKEVMHNFRRMIIKVHGKEGLLIRLIEHMGRSAYHRLPDWRLY